MTNYESITYRSSVRAIQWSGDEAQVADIEAQFPSLHTITLSSMQKIGGDSTVYWIIDTTMGEHRVEPGNWIVECEDDQYLVCNDEWFTACFAPIAASGTSKPVWVVYTNTDLTEGRGYDVPIAICACEATAVRLAKGRYVQGTNSPVRTSTIFRFKNLTTWYAPLSLVEIIQPTPEDKQQQAVLDLRQKAIQKVLAAGCTPQELSALGLSLPL